MTLGTANQLESNARYNELRAQEEARWMAQKQGLLEGVAGADLSQRGADQGRSRFDVEAAQTNQAQKDAMQRFYDDLRFKGVQGAAQANQAYGAAQQGTAGQVLGINAQREQNAADRNAAFTGKVMEAGAGYAGLASTNNKPGGGAPDPAPADPYANNQAPTDEEWKNAWDYNAWRGKQP